MKGTEQGKTFLVSPSPTTSGDSLGTRGQLHCTAITHIWCSSSLRSELPHSLEGNCFSLHLYQKGNLNWSLWRKWWRTFAHSFLAIIKTLTRGCYNEPSFLLFRVCLGNTEQNNTAKQAKISSEATWLWKSSEAQKETMTALCYQSARAQIELTGAQQQLWTLIL